jgi:hypothetical protein
MGIQVTSTAFEDDLLFLQASSQAVKLWFFPKFLAAILLTNKGQNAFSSHFDPCLLTYFGKQIFSTRHQTTAGVYDFTIPFCPHCLNTG